MPIKNNTTAMNVVIFTSNAIRHMYVANMLAERADRALIVSECKPHDTLSFEGDKTSVQKHFQLRYETERAFFAGHDVFSASTLPILHKEVNMPYVYEVVKKFKPTMAYVFGSWIIKDPLLSLIPQGKFINLHLGLSPYYRGSGTNFWPFVNKELEYVGATILHIDSGIDTGDILAHVVPQFEENDTVHTIGCKVIRESARTLVHVMGMVRAGKTLPRTPQWEVQESHYYRSRDFNEEALARYYENLHGGMIGEYIRAPKKSPRLIFLEDEPRI